MSEQAIYFTAAVDMSVDVGIRDADGDFRPLLNENCPKVKAGERVILVIERSTDTRNGAE